MGFWSGLGNILLKAAPIAASFIPGVGPLASKLIQAGTSVGSDIASNAIANKGIGPSQNVMNSSMKQASPMSSQASSMSSSGLGPSPSMMGQMPGAVDPLGQSNQNNPNLADALSAGRQAGMVNSLPRFVNALGQQQKKQQPMYQ